MERPPDRLDSWKAIAEYLGRDRTTVMRWERTAGLPVRRVAGGGGHSVFAYRSEIDQWLATQGGAGNGSAERPAPNGAAAAPAAQTPSASSRPLVQRRTAVLAIIFLATAAMALLARRAPRQVTRASLAGEAIEAFDGAGRRVWRRPLPNLGGPSREPRIVVTDLDGDGRSEVVAALQFRRREGGEGRGELLVFDAKGNVRIRRVLDGTFRFGARDYGPPWFPDDLLVYRTGRDVRISVAAHHHTWWPGLLATFDREGRPVAQFVNAGWIHTLNVTSDRRHLLAAGVNNSFGGPSLAILDAAAPRGTSPAGGSLPPCQNCPAGLATRYFVAGWSEIARPAATPFTGITQVVGNSIQWRMAQDSGKERTPETIVTLSPEFQILDRSVDDSFAETRARLQRTGQLAPAGTWRFPTIQEWTPATGWQESGMAPKS